MISAKPTSDYRANQEIVRVLEASKALSESIVDELPIVLAMVDDRRQILKLNLEGQRVLGCDEANVLGKDVVKVLPASTAKRIAEYFDTMEANGAGRLVFEDEFTVGDSKTFYHWQICPVYRDRQSQRQVLVLIGNDTSDARASHQKLVELRKDLEVAGAVQSMLLPPKLTRSSPTFNLAGHYESSAQVGGDLWWYIVIPGFGLLSIVADAMGHGAGSALAAATLAGALHALVHHHELRTGTDVARLLRDLNRTVSVTYQDRYMVSLGSVWMNELKETVEITGAGFPAMLLMPAAGGSSSMLVAGDPLGLGITSFKIQTREFPMGPGDRVVCFTDGCYEFACDGEPFRRQRLVKVFEQFRQLDPEAACKAVAQVLREKRGKEFADDDMTFVIIDRV